MGSSFLGFTANMEYTKELYIFFLDFPESGVYPTFQSVPNPYSCTVSTNGVVEVVGTSGQNLLDLMSNTDIEDPLDALECLLKYGHLVPTSPDTLGCYPYHDRDPFVMARKPSIFFAANQKEFGQRYSNCPDFF